MLPSVLGASPADVSFNPNINFAKLLSLSPILQMTKLRQRNNFLEVQSKWQDENELKVLFLSLSFCKIGMLILFFEIVVKVLAL